MTAFKERETGEPQYFLNENGEWELTNENHIMSLWHVWVSHPLSDRYFDEDNYLVYTYKKEKP